MDFHSYPVPSGLRVIPDEELDLRSDAEIDQHLLNPKPLLPESEKNVWFFWHSGYAGMHPYTQRNIRAWHRRLAKHGWTIRVLDQQPGSTLNVGTFLDVSDPGVFPQAFRDSNISGPYARQHASDLVRWPLLLRYGGVYADVGLMQIGDLDRLWRATVGDPDSKYEVLSYNMGPASAPDLTNYFLASRRGNPLFQRCHKLLLALWEGRTCTDGLHAHPLLRDVPLMGVETHGVEVAKELTDYIVQGQTARAVMRLVDAEDGWDGPRYVAEHVYAIDYMVGSQWVNELTGWDGREAFRLLSLRLPADGEGENEDQKKARRIVQECLQRSFAFKLAHGLILKVLGDTLGSLWRKHEGSDDIPGTYAHWLRYGMLRWTQESVPPPLDFPVVEPFRRGPLLSVA